MGLSYIQLPTPDAPLDTRYVMPDPRGLDPDAYHDWRNRVLCAEVSKERSMLLQLMAMAETYTFLTTHPAGTEATVRQLREVRRALRENT